MLEAHDKALKDVMANHYSLPRGRASLRQAVSRYLSPSFNLPEGRALDVNTEVQITAGANEGEPPKVRERGVQLTCIHLAGMFAFAAAFLRDGDEVILFEPCESSASARASLSLSHVCRRSGSHPAPSYSL